MRAETGVPVGRIGVRRGRGWRIPPAAPFIAPAFLALGLVLLFPLVYSVYLSFGDISPRMGVEFSGPGNFVRISGDATVRAAIWNTFGFTLFSVAGQLLLGMAAALLLNQPIRGRRWLRLLLLLPWIIPPVATALLWRWMLDAHFGVVNDFLVRVGLLQGFMSWLGSPDLAMPSTILVNVWRGYPFVAIMLLAGLQAVPQEQYEAAQVDGCNVVQAFFHITLPSIRYLIGVATTMSAIWAFKEFALVQVLTEGGPAGATEILGTQVYKMFFRFNRYGEAAALGVVILAALFVFSFIYMRLLSRDEEAA